MSTYYTSKYSGEQIDEAVKKIMDGEMTGDYADRQLSNLDTPQAALANLGAGVRPNLLDNAIFIGGGSQQGGGQLPVNQRGQTSYTAAGSQPIFDRWKANSATVSLNADDITVTGNQGYGNMTQLIENWDSFAGKTVTLSALITGGDGVGNGAYIDMLDGVTEYITQIASVGLIYKTVTLPDNITKLELGIVTSNVAGKTLGCKAIKFELGDTQTLAYQDEDGAWQLLPQPESDYATQLAKCRKYLLMGNMESTHFVGGMAFLPTPVSMRTVPVIVGTPMAYTVSTNTPQPDVALSVFSTFMYNGVIVNYAGAAGPCYVFFPAGSGLSCEL